MSKELLLIFSIYNLPIPSMYLQKLSKMAMLTKIIRGFCAMNVENPTYNFIVH